MTIPHVVVTRPRGVSSALDAFVAKLTSLGYQPVVFSPQVVQAVVMSADEEKQVQDFLADEDPCVALLSPTAVFAFREVLNRAGLKVGDRKIRFASQGPGTSLAIKECFGVEPFFEASRSTGEDFVAELSRLPSCPRSVLIPQSAIGREVVGPLLREAGARVLEVITYTLNTRRPEESEQQALKAAATAGGYILFMSSSAVQATIDTVRERGDLSRLRVISIGPTTSKTARECGLFVTEEAHEHTEEGVLGALQRATTPGCGR